MTAQHTPTPLQTALDELDVRASATSLGLGTRHIAAASISTTTATIAVVVSESSIVRVYSGGNLLTEILPELWLLHRYMPHIASTTLTGDQEHNLAIVSETSASPRSGAPDRVRK